MYTIGIRKIFESKTATKLSEMFEQATKAGYVLFLWNGTIYLIIDDYYKSTGLDIYDFRVSLA